MTQQHREQRQHSPTDNDTADEPAAAHGLMSQGWWTPRCAAR